MRSAVRWCIALGFVPLLFLGSAAAQIQNKAHPFLPQPPGYYVSLYRESPLDSHVMQQAAAAVPKDRTVEGRKLTVGYLRDRGTLPGSRVLVVRHYEQAIKDAGGSVLYTLGSRAEPTYLGFRLDRGAETYWGEVDATAGGNDFKVTTVAVSRVAVQAPEPVAATPTPRAEPASIPVPLVSSFTPNPVTRGTVAGAAGQALGHTNAVTLVSAQGVSYPVEVWRYVPEVDRLKLAVPEVPPGPYQLTVRSATGSTTSAVRLQVNVTPVAADGRADARQQEIVAMRRIIEELLRANWLQPGDATRLLERVNRGAYRAATQLMDEANRIMRQRAVEAVNGAPVTDAIVAIAMRSGRPIHEVAQQWLHCHSLSIAGSATSVESLSIGRREDAGRILGGCMPGAERHHSHVMPGGIKHGPALAEAAQRGLPPPVMPPHYHTEAGFPTGLVFVLTERDEWYEVLGSAIVQAYEYCQRNGTCLELVSAGAVCLATGGIGCAPLAGAVARNVAIILVEEEVVPVPAGGREAALNFVRTVGQ